MSVAQAKRYRSFWRDDAAALKVLSDEIDRLRKKLAKRQRMKFIGYKVYGLATGHVANDICISKAGAASEVKAYQNAFPSDDFVSAKVFIEAPPKRGSVSDAKHE